MPFVYVIKRSSGDGTFYKIGRTADVGERLVQLQTGFPDKVRLVQYVEVEEAGLLEARLHKLFGRARIKGSEWFRLSKLDLINVLGYMKILSNHRQVLSEEYAWGDFMYELQGTVPDEYRNSRWIYLPGHKEEDSPYYVAKEVLKVLVNEFQIDACRIHTSKGRADLYASNTMATGIRQQSFKLRFDSSSQVQNILEWKIVTDLWDEFLGWNYRYLGYPRHCWHYQAPPAGILVLVRAKGDWTASEVEMRIRKRFESLPDLSINCKFFTT